jgi:hypothetical protein
MGLEHATNGVWVLFILSITILFFYIRKIKRIYTHTPFYDVYVRKISGINAIDEAVGRAAELGRPISFTTALTAIGPVFYASLGVLAYIARKASTLKSKLFVPQTTPEALAIVEDTVRDAYRESGRLSLFDSQSIMFLSEEQFAFASGYMGLLHRENVASAFLFGSFSGEALILSEAGSQIGAMQVAACISPEQVPFFVCTCDYTLIGEELFAASAYLGKDYIQVGSLYGQDRIKLVFLFMIIVGVGIATWNALFPETMLPNIEKFFVSS